jgi:coenzyme Q-binding protein COQ10
MSMGFGEPIRYTQSADLPYGTERMFDLVADVERYPEFLTEYRQVRVVSRSGDTLHVDQVIGFFAVELTLSAVATLRRPESIIVRTQHGLMGDLEVRWSFKPSELGTSVDFGMVLMPSTRFAAGLVGYLLTKSAERTLQAFTKRAQHVYGNELLLP